MYFKKIAFLGCLACLTPIVADATMIYVPSNPCACDNRPCDDVVVLSRDFRKEGVVKKAKKVEQPKKVEKKKTETKKTKTTKNQPWRRYASINFALNMWTWKNDYSSDYMGADLLFSEDSYSSQSVFGGSVALGTKITDNLRSEVELGMTAKFEDKDEAATYSLSAPYLMLNVYHDFKYGFYIGAGLGVTKTKVAIDGLLFNGSTSASESVSTKLRAMATAGYGVRLSKNLFLDAQYRLAGFKAPDVSREFWWDQYTGTYDKYMLKIKGSLLLENAISVGLRFVF